MRQPTTVATIHGNLYGPMTQFCVGQKNLANVGSRYTDPRRIETERASNAQVMCELKKLASISPLHLRGEEVNTSKPLNLRTGHDSEDGTLGYSRAMIRPINPLEDNTSRQ